MMSIHEKLAARVTGPLQDRSCAHGRRTAGGMIR